MNKVILIGNLTRDPELKVTASNLSVCNFSVAVNRRFTNSEGKREVDFINIVTFRGTADNCGKYLTKGSKVGISGSLQIRSYEGNDGVKRISAEVIADEVQFLSTKNDQSSAGNYSGNNYGGFDDGVEDLPEVKNNSSKSTIESLKPINDDSVPF